MYQRVVIGLAALSAATSCVAPVDDARVAHRAPIAARHAAPAQKLAMMIPAGPPPILLQPPAGAIDATAITQAPPFVGAAQPDVARRALDCLTAAVYYEARSEPLEGQEAVAQVVLNRVRNPAFPNSVCGTVYEGSSRETGCQFTFTCDGSLAARREPAAWERARLVATAALAGFVYAPIGSATYYHTTAILPWWASSLTRVGTIGAHIFYRLRGAWGSSVAFDQRYSGIEPAAAIGVRYPEKAAAQVAESIEAGVAIHRGGSPEDGAIAKRFGVTLHRGGDEPAARAFGVIVHVMPSADAKPAETTA